MQRSLFWGSAVWYCVVQSGLVYLYNVTMYSCVADAVSCCNVWPHPTLRGVVYVVALDLFQDRVVQSTKMLFGLV